MNARSIPFLKMNGLGNDFVVWDARDEPLRLPVETIRTIGDRATGIGFDQMITVETSPAGADAFMRIHNRDGSEVDANFRLASRNIPAIDVLPIEGINVYDILRREKLVLTKAAVSALEERFK